MAEKRRLTKEGYDERKARLDLLKNVKRDEVAEKIEVARQQGDLSENADYQSAKEEQTDIENEIAKLEQLLDNVEIIGDSFLTITDKKTGETTRYQIVGDEDESDIFANKISEKCPVFIESRGKKKGDEFVVSGLDNGEEFTYEYIFDSYEVIN